MDWAQRLLSTDRRFGLILTLTVTHAAAFDGVGLPDLLDPDNTGRAVWADTAYRSAKNETLMAARGFRSEAHRKKPRASPWIHVSGTNNRRSVVRAHIERQPSLSGQGPHRACLGGSEAQDGPVHPNHRHRPVKD